MFNVREQGESLDGYLQRCINQELYDSKEEDRYIEYKQKNHLKLIRIYNKKKNVRKRERNAIYTKEMNRRSAVDRSRDMYLEEIEIKRLNSISHMFVDEYMELCKKYKAMFVCDYEGGFRLQTFNPDEPGG